MRIYALKIGTTIIFLFCYTQALFLAADYGVHGRISLDFGWDSEWYKDIIDNGYQLPDPDGSWRITTRSCLSNSPLVRAMRRMRVTWLARFRPTYGRCMVLSECTIPSNPSRR